MTNIADLRSVFRILDQHGIKMDYYAALNLADDLVRSLVTFHTDPQPALRYIAANDRMIRSHFEAGKKIQAIKEMRSIASCGLKEAKDAVESVYGTGAWYPKDHDVALQQLREKLTGE